ncbi:UDP-glucose dehydrogenase family protein [Aestuariirhabdus sp. LZHN29]|uniref:UDP-glucose dehydrogenase family protein n=1 Tax=Aestuariirhabdus sp. LZHN29 TaxID=3417462 RepID=UPI003CEE649E
MKVTVFGTGYVGLVTGTCLADAGHDVVCVDIDKKKIEMLNKGEVPIYEPGLEAVIKKGTNSARLSFTTNAEYAVQHGLFQFIAVGTPPDEDGSADLKYVFAVADTIAKFMDSYKVIVNKSTVPVGTRDEVRRRVCSHLDSNRKKLDFDVVSNPEFLKEGAALHDFMKPDRIIVGSQSFRAIELLKELYLPFNRNHDRLIVMDPRSAELTKYAANAMLATKISFMNELANLAEHVGADIENVRNGIGSDNRIGYSFIYPGCGYGGSCFPKDVAALGETARDVGFTADLLKSVEKVNDKQKKVLFEKISKHYRGELSGKVFALWGLSFKPNTDDMRAAPSRVVMEALWEAGASVRVFDPEAMNECRRIYGDREGLLYCKNPDEALECANALVIVTEWQIFRSPDFNIVKAALREPVIFDGRNIYNPGHLKKSGFTYYAIGRGDSVK